MLISSSRKTRKIFKIYWQNLKILLLLQWKNKKNLNNFNNKIQIIQCQKGQLSMKRMNSKKVDWEMAKREDLLETKKFKIYIVNWECWDAKLKWSMTGIEEKLFYRITKDLIKNLMKAKNKILSLNLIKLSCWKNSKNLI